MKTLAITSMYANPLHPGHVECLVLSKEKADELWVIMNNDMQAEMKRGVKSFQDEKYRSEIVTSLKPVDRVFISIDQDSSVCKSLEFLIQEGQSSGRFDKIIFTKGGDRFATEIPEAKICRELGVEIIDGLGEKTHNSSELVNKIKNKADEISIVEALAQLPKEHQESRYLEIGKRPWGIYYVLEDSPLYKVKKIVVDTGKRLSLQSHKHRAEHWTVVSGIANVDIRHPDFKEIEQVKVLTANEGIHIPQGHIHRLANTHAEPLVLIEVQCGKYTGEDDIERYEDDFGRK